MSILFYASEPAPTYPLTNLHYTLGITSPSVYSYRWIYGMTSLNSGTSGSAAITGTVEDLTRIS